jgi:hypothetical protein
MPPLVPQLRRKVKEWRESGYVGAAATSRSLLNWGFNINRVQKNIEYDFVYVDQGGFERYKPKSFGNLIEGFREFKEAK